MKAFSRYWLIVVVLHVLFVAAAAAQSECAQGLPCQAVPWRMPVFPRLQSPTPETGLSDEELHEFFDPVAPSPTPGPSPTVTPDLSGGIDSGLATLQAQMQATVPGISNLDGSYNAGGFSDVVNGLADYGNSPMSTFFSYTKAFAQANIGPFSPLLFFLFFRFFVKIVVRFSTKLIPVFVAIFGFLRKIVQTVLEFIPG